MDRRDFLKQTGMALAGIALSGTVLDSCKTGKAVPREIRKKMRGHFSMTQISSSIDSIGNSYLFKTAGGKVFMMDGGQPADEAKLREFLAKAGNHVDSWFLSHPHGDHIGALDKILHDRQGVVIDKIYHSRMPDFALDTEKGSAVLARDFYDILASQTETEVFDLQETGGRYDVDGVAIKVLGVQNPEITTNLSNISAHSSTNMYNNSSIIFRVWDDSKSILFLGDAGKECGDKLMDAWPDYLDCDYVQMAHHGQSGCDEHFYKSFDFRACMWPTPSWVWAPSEKHPWLTTWETRRWMDEKGIKEHHPSCVEQDWFLA